MVLIRSNSTQKRRRDNAPHWNIPDVIWIFDKRVTHAVSCVFHSFISMDFIDSPISPIIFELNPYNFIVLYYNECGS